VLARCELLLKEDASKNYHSAMILAAAKRLKIDAVIIDVPYLQNAADGRHERSGTAEIEIGIAVR
jgi:hypothetical protein